MCIVVECSVQCTELSTRYQSTHYEISSLLIQCSSVSDSAVQVDVLPQATVRDPMVRGKIVPATKDDTMDRLGRIWPLGPTRKRL